MGRSRRPLITPREAFVLGCIFALALHQLYDSSSDVGDRALTDNAYFDLLLQQGKSSAAEAVSNTNEIGDDEAAARCLAILRRCRESKRTKEGGRDGNNHGQRRRRRRLQELQGTREKSQLLPTRKQEKHAPVQIRKQEKGVLKGWRAPKKELMRDAKGNIYPRPDCKFRGPYQSMVPCYTTEALEREMERHDRWVVDSLAYLQAFDGGAISTYQSNMATVDKTKPVTFIILTVNRYVQYLAVLVTSLLRGHDPAYLRDHVDLHIINIERRPCRCGYSLFSELKARLPFVTFHDWTAPYPEHSNMTGATKLYYADQRRDYIRVLEICIEKGSDWCFVFEDDVIATANLIRTFLKLTSSTAPEQYGTDWRTKLAVISMYYPLNDLYNFNDRQIWSAEYANSEQYQLDANASQYIAQTEGGEGTGNTDDGTTTQESIRYVFERNDRKYGMAANAYPSEVLEMLVDYLKREPSHNTTEATDVTIMSLFTKEMYRAKLKISPSPVNHVGHYSEHRKDGRHGVYFYMSTDVRFKLEDGWDSNGSLTDSISSETTGHAFH